MTPPPAPSRPSLSAGDRPDPFLTLADAAAGLRDGHFSARALTALYLDRIRTLDERVHAYVAVLEEGALADAEAADERLARGQAVPLTGIPIALKDIFTMRGVETTCASRMLEHYRPIADAFVVQRLRQAGAIILGKTNMDEFAMGSSTEHSAFFPTRNPWDLDRVPGGSSGGSAAAVAAGEAIAALGTDTGGSIRQPAAFCGLVGMKPTYGRVSRFGMIAFASSLDQGGPITRSVEDAAIVLQAIAGRDEADSTTVDLPVPDFRADLHRGLDGLRIAAPREYFAVAEGGIQPEVRDAVEQALRVLEQHGATVDRTVSLPLTEYALPVYYILAPSEASANLARYDGVKYGYSYREGDSMWDNMEKTRQYGFGDEVKRRIMLGTYALSAGYYDAFYRKAQQVRTLIRREFAHAFSRYDLIVGPTAPTVAFALGAVTDPYEMYLNDVFTIPVNIAGLPALSLPCGRGQGGLPVGLQFIANSFGEVTLFRGAHAYQQLTDWHTRTPSL